MTPARRLCRILLFGTLMLALGACAEPGDERADVSNADLLFSISEGQSDNHFIRQNGVSGHLNLRTHPKPRLVVAFPAGNSGAALFFEDVVNGPVWGSVSDIQVIQRTDEAGRILYGMQADITIEAERLSLEEAEVGSVRFLRKAVDYSRLPPRGKPDVHIDGNQIRFFRERPDGEIQLSHACGDTGRRPANR